MQRQHSRKVVTNLEINDEVKFFISENKAKKFATHINFDAIRQLKQQGKILRPALMKNNLIAYVIQSPLWNYYEKGDIDSTLFAVGLKYTNDHFESLRDNMAKQSYDGLPMSISSKSGNKEPSQKQIDAFKRVCLVKRELNRISQYPTPKKRVLNRRYAQILELFLEKEIKIAEMKVIMNLGHQSLKQRIIEALLIAKRVYERN